MADTQPPKQAPAAGSRKYEVVYKDGGGLICIDLVGDTPENVERDLQVMFGKYGIAEIRR